MLFLQYIPRNETYDPWKSEYIPISDKKNTTVWEFPTVDEYIFPLKRQVIQYSKINPLFNHSD